MKPKLLLSFFFAAILFTACSDDNDSSVAPDTVSPYADLQGTWLSSDAWVCDEPLDIIHVNSNGDLDVLRRERYGENELFAVNMTVTLADSTFIFTAEDTTATYKWNIDRNILILSHEQQIIELLRDDTSDNHEIEGVWIATDNFLWPSLRFDGNYAHELPQLYQAPKFHFIYHQGRLIFDSEWIRRNSYNVKHNPSRVDGRCMTLYNYSDCSGDFLDVHDRFIKMDETQCDELMGVWVATHMDIWTREGTGQVPYCEALQFSNPEGRSERHLPCDYEDISFPYALYTTDFDREIFNWSTKEDTLLMLSYEDEASCHKFEIEGNELTLSANFANIGHSIAFGPTRHFAKLVPGQKDPEIQGTWRYIDNPEKTIHFSSTGGPGSMYYPCIDRNIGASYSTNDGYLFLRHHFVYGTEYITIALGYEINSAGQLELTHYEALDQDFPELVEVVDVYERVEE